jgi:hypothetical protein
MKENEFEKPQRKKYFSFGQLNTEKFSVYANIFVIDSCY